MFIQDWIINIRKLTQHVTFLVLVMLLFPNQCYIDKRLYCTFPEKNPVLSDFNVVYQNKKKGQKNKNNAMYCAFMWFDFIKAKNIEHVLAVNMSDIQICFLSCTFINTDKSKGLY